MIPVERRRRDFNEIDFIKIFPHFINMNQDKINIDFLYGYCVHILTDIYWINFLMDVYWVRYPKKEDIAMDKLKKQCYYHDINIIERALSNEYAWLDEVVENLRCAKTFDFLDLLAKKEITLWREKIISQYTSSSFNIGTGIKKLKCICIADVKNFISTYSQIIKNDIEKNYL